MPTPSRSDRIAFWKRSYARSSFIQANAHRDLAGPIADWGFVSQVQILVEPTAIQVNTLSPIMENERAEQILPLFGALIRLIDDELAPFFEHFNPLPAPGLYALSLEESPVEWLWRIEPSE